MSELSPDALSQFEAALADEEFIERITSYALRRKRSRYWRGVWDGHLPEGKEVVDLVYEAVDDVLLGRRTWDAIKHPDLLGFMRSIINSKISHLLVGSENQTQTLAEDPSDSDGVDYFDTLPYEEATTASELLQEKEDEERNSELIFEFFDFVADDKLLQGIVGCMIEGVYKRSKIATSLQVREQEITNANKRMERRFMEFRNTHTGKNPFTPPKP